MDKSLAIHHKGDPHADISVPDSHQDTYSKTLLGFWIYLMTDCLLFGTLFTVYGVLHHETFGGPSSQEIFSLKLAFSETMILLFSSVTCGLAILSAVKGNRKNVVGWLIVTFLLGATFIGMELAEFTELVKEGHSWEKSAFLSSFFTLVGTHGLHVSFGLIWILVMIFQVQFLGITIDTFRRLAVFGLFWHFLDLVWIFIFTFVYLMGVV